MSSRKPSTSTSTNTYTHLLDDLSQDGKSARLNVPVRKQPPAKMPRNGASGLATQTGWMGSVARFWQVSIDMSTDTGTANWLDPVLTKEFNGRKHMRQTMLALPSCSLPICWYNYNDPESTATSANGRDIIDPISPRAISSHVFYQ
jgi:hypothetical protein